jgi:site-specific DNA-cytosine methylase
MRILIACEESDEVRSRFEKYGFDAWSCDLQPNRNTNAKHYQGNVFDIINDGWDAMIAFPPCTHLAVSGAAWFEQKRKDGRQQEGINFFMAMVNAPIKYIAIENPVGIMSKIYKPPTQIIQPYYFGDEAQKTTCLWLKNLPPLYHNAYPNLFDSSVTHVGKGEFYNYIDKNGRQKRQAMWFAAAKGFGGHKAAKDVSKVRSKTFPGIAQAMADQWSVFIKQALAAGETL